MVNINVHSQEECGNFIGGGELRDKDDVKGNAATSGDGNSTSFERIEAYGGRERRRFGGKSEEKPTTYQSSEFKKSLQSASSISFTPGSSTIELIGRFCLAPFHLQLPYLDFSYVTEQKSPPVKIDKGVERTPRAIRTS